MGQGFSDGYFAGIFNPGYYRKGCGKNGKSLFGMYNTGYQHYLAIGESPGFRATFVFGFLAVIPIVAVSYIVGLGIEFTVAQWKGHEIQEGFLVSGMLIPLIVPVDTPLWMIALLSVFAGGILTVLLFNAVGTTPAMQVNPLQQILMGGFAFGAVFMATDPVTSCRTETGKYIFGFLVGAFAMMVRVLNPGYPEGMMLAILFMNSFAPLIDYAVVEANTKRRLERRRERR